MNKKAQAQIITTVLIILLVLAAIVIVWQVIQGTVEGGAKQVEGQTDCLTVNLEIESLTASIADDPNTPNDNEAIAGAIKVHRKVGAGDLQKIRIIIDGTAIDPDTDASDLKELGSKSITTALTSGQEIKIAAMIGSEDRVCDVADTKTV